MASRPGGAKPCPTDLPAACATSLEALAREAPRVHCITNTVAMTYTANVLLAVGANPSLSAAPGEVTALVDRARALCVNIGTLDALRRAAIGEALEAAAGRGIPWVLDPVFVDAAPSRLAFALKLLARGPRVVRGNPGEIAALAGPEPTDAERLARSRGTVVAVTGAEDLITDGRRRLRMAGGHPLMARVTAMGCAASALVAAFLAVVEDPWEATAQALLALSVAGELAGAGAPGPGSFQYRILDALYALEREDLTARRRVCR